MSILAKKYFRDEASAFHHLEGLLWPDGPICSHCGTIGKAGRLEGVRSKPSKKNPEGIVRHGLWKCYSKECRKQFIRTTGTDVTHNSARTSLRQSNIILLLRRTACM